MSPIHYNQERGTLTIDVSAPTKILSHVREFATANQFTLKKEFHITPIGFALGRNLLEKHRTLMPHVERLAESFEWRMEFHNKYFLVKKHFMFRNSPEEDRESIIVIANATCLEEFWQKLNEMLDENLELPLPHVTLATKSTNPNNQSMGIGIQSFSDFETFQTENITDKLHN